MSAVNEYVDSNFISDSHHFRYRLSCSIFREVLESSNQLLVFLIEFQNEEDERFLDDSCLSDRRCLDDFGLGLHLQKLHLNKMYCESHQSSATDDVLLGT